jgi:uncharacterized membrane protein YkoI
MHKRFTTALVGIVALGALGGIASASGSGDGPGGSRLDDGKQLLSQAGITEQQAITTAQGAATGPLNEVDLEHAGGALVFNVDVGDSDVKVDAGSGKGLSVSKDD